MLGFLEVVVIDFEFSAPPGERPDPVCLVAHELVSGRRTRMFQSELRTRQVPPYPIGRDILYVAIDTNTLSKLRSNWTEIKKALIARTDAANIYERTTFKVQRWAEFMEARNIPWPMLPSGQLDLCDDAFRVMAGLYPTEVEHNRQLRFLLSQMRLEQLTVGQDGRNRCLLSAFRSVTGRNQPSNTKFIFGPAVWLRGLVRPEPGYGLAYIDWSQQEFGIAAYLSLDSAMIAAYESGDPYLAFAKQAGTIPVHGTKQTHGPIRERFKSCALGVLFGMGANSLAGRIGQSTAHARELLRLHQQTFPTFHGWSDRAVDYACLRGSISASFGWAFHVGPNTNPRTLRNFPMQANGAEMLRLACCLATERGVRVCAPIHDALLIEARLEDLPDVVATTQEAMAEASAWVLDGYRLRSDAEVFRYPDRFEDERGKKMWSIISEILADFGNHKNSLNSSLSLYVPMKASDTPYPRVPRIPLYPRTAACPQNVSMPATPVGKVQNISGYSGGAFSGKYSTREPGKGVE